MGTSRLIILGRYALTTAALTGGCGEVVGSMEPSERPMYVRIAGETPYPLRGIEVDSATYAEMVGDGRGVVGVTDGGPSANGARQVRFAIDADGPALLYESLLGPGPGAAAYTTPDFAVLLGGSDDDEAQAIALLLPAVQKASDVSVDADGTFVIALSGAGSIVPNDEPLPTWGGISVASKDVKGFMGGNAEPMPLGASLEFSLAESAAFVREGAGLQNDRLRLAGPKNGWPTWFDPALPTWASIDMRQPGGPIVHRFRIDPAIALVDGMTITVAPAKSAYLKIGDIKTATRDGAAEAAMFAASYAGYSGRANATAATALGSFRDLSAAGGPPSLGAVQAYWQDRATIVGQLHAAVAHAAEYQALICQVALPTTLAAAKALDAHATALSGDPARPLADTFEALRAVPAPMPGAHSTPLAITAVAGASAQADVGIACQALDSVASLRDALAEATGTPHAAADMLTRVATITASPRQLDRAMVEWIELVDAIVGGTAGDTNAALAAAWAKANLLIDSLGAHNAASSARWALAEEIVKP